ncbi:MAG: rhodanese-like domain-containing protein [Gammaproteobacteria bacterium]|nr:rhodanese-like domain-containing protein [Gammaproteobacteria bacterium]
MNIDRLFSLVILLCALAVSGYTAAAGPGQTDAGASPATPDWYYPAIVDTKFLAEYAVIPKRKDVAIVDSRPARKYDKGHIVPAINIPKRQFDAKRGRLPENKATLLIFYCGGFKCPLSHQSAFLAEKLGYTNIKVYAAGYPVWVKNGHIPGVSTAAVKKLIDKKSGAMIVDARPARKFKKSHLPTAINIPYRQFSQMTDKLPAAKDATIIFYCGGYKCPLSPKSAAKAVNLGYTKVKLYQPGWPAWKAAYGSGK